jgi:PAS domain S-box-containing protein
MKHSILVRFIVFITLLLLVSGVGIGLFVSRSHNAVLEREILHNLSDEAYLQDSHIIWSVRILQEDVRFLADIPPIQGLVRTRLAGGKDPLDGSSAESWLDRLNSGFSSFLKAKSDYSQVRFIGVAEDGREIIRVEKSQGVISVVPSHNLQKKGNRRYFKETIRLNPGQVYLSDIDLNQEHGKVDESRTPVLRAAVPVFQANGSPFGIIIINLNFSKVFDKIRQTTNKKRVIYLVNESGDYLLHPDRQMQFAFQFGGSQRIQDRFPQINTILNQEGAVTNISFQAVIDKDEKAVHFHKIKFDAHHPQRFVGVALETSYRDMVSKSDRLRNTSFLMTALLIVVGCVTAVFIVRRLTRPLIKLTRSADKVAEGIYDVDLPANQKGELGVLTGSFQTMIDRVRERTEKLEERSAEIAKLFRAVEQSSGIIVITDANEIIEYVNPTFVENYGYEMDEVIGKNISVLQADNMTEADYVKLWQTIRSGQEWQGEFHNQKKNGDHCWMLSSISPVKNTKGDITHFIESQANLDNIKQTEVELKTAIEEAHQASQAKSLFLSSMSHELRTPLNSILGFAQLMASERFEPLSDRQKEGISQILKGGNHLLNLINEVLDLSRIEAGNIQVYLEDTELAPIIEDVLTSIEPLAEKNRVRVINEIACGGVFVKADFTRFKQVLMNLLSNAVKYNVEGGTVTLGCDNFSSQKIRISVSDTGSGIAEDKFDKLFEPFDRLGKETSDIEGTGIGLTITKRLVDLMNAELGFESEVGTGSTFYVDFEKTGHQGQEDEISILAPGDHNFASLKSEHLILYIEDNAANLNLVKNVLQRKTHIEIISADHGQAGVALATERQPDLILMDIDLPDMSGFDALQLLRKTDKTKDIPVVAVSADVMSGTITKALEMGFKDYITKPININRFLKILDNILKVT